MEIPRSLIKQADHELLVKSELNAGKYLHTLQEKTREHGIEAFSIDREVEQIHRKIVTIASDPNRKKPLSIPQAVWESPDLRPIGIYFSEQINPMLAKGSDTYKPTGDAIFEFCSKLSKGEELDIVQYYAFSKSKSPKRTGSPNHVVDMAEIEMLRNYAIVSQVAKKMGIRLGFVIVDESDVMPNDGLIGPSITDAHMNVCIAREVIHQFDCTGEVRLRSLTESVITALGERYPDLYRQRRMRVSRQLQEELNNEEKTALFHRMFTFLDCLSDDAFDAFGIAHADIEKIRSLGKGLDILSLQRNLLDYLMNLTIHIQTVMKMRDDAGVVVTVSGLTKDYPEYNPATKLYGGVTRNKHRWGFLTSPKRYRSRTILPMHGLALYSKKSEYVGNVPFEDLQELERKNEAQIIQIDHKPVFAMSI